MTEIAGHNFDVLSPGKFSVIKGDSLDYLRQSKEYFDLIYLDPSRRGDHNQKLYKLSDCEPDLNANWGMLKSKGNTILVKASPMLDIKQALAEIPDIQQVWVVSVKNEVKEVLLCWEKEKANKEPLIHAVDLIQKEEIQEFIFTYAEEESLQSEFGEVGQYIIEPNTSVLKAGAFRTFGQRFGLNKVNPNSHLYTSDEFPTEIPARIFKVIQIIDQPKKEIKQLFPKGKVNVITRNYALSADDLKKKYKLQDGGNDFLIGTKVGEKFMLLSCMLMSQVNL